MGIDLAKLAPEPGRSNRGRPATFAGLGALGALAALAVTAASCGKTGIRGAGGQGGGAPAGAAGAGASPDGATGGAGGQGGGGTGGGSAGSDPDAGAPDGGLPDPPMAVDPAVSRAWTWTACGTIEPAAPDQAALFDADGSIAVLDDAGRIRTYDASGTRPLASDGPASFLVNEPDGALLVGSATATEIVLRPIGAATARFTFAAPTSFTCGPKHAFSADGEYFLAYGGVGSCVWRSQATAGTTAGTGGNRLPVATISGSIAQATVRNGQLVTIASEDWNPIEIVTRDFAGVEASRVRLDLSVETSTRALLSPAGDRVTTTWGRTALWDAGTGKVVVDLGDLFPNALSQFTPAGDAVLLGNGVFRTADGARVSTLPPGSRAYDSQPTVLSANGRRLLVMPIGGRTALIDLSQPGFATVLGPHLRQTAPTTIGTLAISADASTLAATYGGVVFGFRLASRFEESRTLWTIYAGDQAFVGDISADGQWASAAGDNRALYSGTDGHVIWPQAGVSDVKCWGSQLRISPRGKWAAGASYGGTMDVFSLADAAQGKPWKTAAQFPTSCGDVAAFSRDERIMVTSMPALYRADASGAWQPVWSRSVGSPSGVPPGLREVHLTPDETAVLVSVCDVQPCSTRLYDVATGAILRSLPELTAARPSLSPEGSWIVAAGQLLHLPSGDTRTLDSKRTIATALFTSRGEIIAGTREGALVRYCRTP